ncbi:MAG: carcinine hydrolase/isopenicillin-N N-acyltransferase family protein, partial [Rikenellaceae bacterium]
AYEIASKRETFVNESILVASKKDGCAAIIEKTPDETSIFYSNKEQILCTNHYQSDALKDTDYNIENITTSDSQYRYERLEELLSEYSSINSEDAARILRDRYGKGGEDIGIGNEMTLNQSIAHHSVIFAPASDLMWVSTSSWQSGTMACYDLDGFFNGTSSPTIVDDKSIAADTLFINRDLPRLLNYREYITEINSAIESGAKLSESYIAGFIEQNPMHYYTYRLLGDYCTIQKQPNKAKEFYTKALNCSIPYKTESNEILEIIESL